MATGPEHYRLAEAKLDAARRIAHPDSGHADEDALTLIGVALQRAQVHATLALAAAAALNDPQGGMGGNDWHAWHDAVSVDAMKISEGES